MGKQGGSETHGPEARAQAASAGLTKYYITGDFKPLSEGSKLPKDWLAKRALSAGCIDEIATEFDGAIAAAAKRPARN